MRWDGKGSASPEVFYDWGSLTNLVLINPSVINDEEYKVAERERQTYTISDSSCLILVHTIIPKYCIYEK